MRLKFDPRLPIADVLPLRLHCFVEGIIPAACLPDDLSVRELRIFRKKVLCLVLRGKRMDYDVGCNHDDFLDVSRLARRLGVTHVLIVNKTGLVTIHEWAEFDAYIRDHLATFRPARGTQGDRDYQASYFVVDPDLKPTGYGSGRRGGGGFYPQYENEPAF